MGAIKELRSVGSQWRNRLPKHKKPREWGWPLVLRAEHRQGGSEHDAQTTRGEGGSFVGRAERSPLRTHKVRVC